MSDDSQPSTRTIHIHTLVETGQVFRIFGNAYEVVKVESVDSPYYILLGQGTTMVPATLYKVTLKRTDRKPLNLRANWP